MTDALRQFMIAQGYAQHVIDRGIVGYLLPNWEATVKAIENGYGDIFEEYTNDISSRDIIEECRELWPKDQKEEIALRLDAADKRFIAATVPITEPVWNEDGINRQDHFWLFRAPESCLGEFLLTKMSEQNCGRQPSTRHESE